LNDTGSEHPPKRPGPSNILSNRDERTLKRIVKDDRNLTLTLITDQLNSAAETTLIVQTVRKYIRKQGWISCFACKKPYLTDKSARIRLEWAKEHHGYEWNSVIFTDESRFCLFGSDGCLRIWRKANERFHKACIQPTIKFGGGSVMFWGCISWWGVGPLVLVDGTMNSEEYIDTLAKHFIPWARGLDTGGTQLIFQQDLAAVHTSNYSSWWMESHGFKILKWAAQSPDLNPIENLWTHLDNKVRKRSPLPLNKNELIKVVQEEWRNLPIEYIQALIGSMPRRVEATIKAKGWHTKY
jgi:transposase